VEVGAQRHVGVASLDGSDHRDDLLGGPHPDGIGNGDGAYPAGIVVVDAVHHGGDRCWADEGVAEGTTDHRLDSDAILARSFDDRAVVR
jgi:hypothetical protein